MTFTCMNPACDNTSQDLFCSQECSSVYGYNPKPEKPSKFKPYNNPACNNTTVELHCSKFCRESSYAKPSKQAKQTNNCIFCDKSTKNKAYCSSLCKIQHSEDKKRQQESIKIAKRLKFKEEIMGLSGGCCQYCGHNDISQLEFHHINPQTKSFNIGTETQSCKITPKLLSELDKCILLCISCHRTHHAEFRQIKIYQSYLHE